MSLNVITCHTKAWYYDSVIVRQSGQLSRCILLILFSTSPGGVDFVIVILKNKEIRIWKNRTLVSVGNITAMH